MIPLSKKKKKRKEKKRKTVKAFCSEETPSLIELTYMAGYIGNTLNILCDVLGGYM